MEEGTSIHGAAGDVTRSFGTVGAGEEQQRRCRRGAHLPFRPRVRRGRHRGHCRDWLRHQSRRAASLAAGRNEPPQWDRARRAQGTCDVAARLAPLNLPVNLFTTGIGAARGISGRLVRGAPHAEGPPEAPSLARSRVRSCPGTPFHSGPHRRVPADEFNWGCGRRWFGPSLVGCEGTAAYVVSHMPSNVEQIFSEVGLLFPTGGRLLQCAPRTSPCRRALETTLREWGQAISPHPANGLLLTASSRPPSTLF